MSCVLNLEKLCELCKIFLARSQFKEFNQVVNMVEVTNEKEKLVESLTLVVRMTCKRGSPDAVKFAADILEFLEGKKAELDAERAELALPVGKVVAA